MYKDQRQERSDVYKITYFIIAGTVLHGPDPQEEGDAHFEYPGIDSQQDPGHIQAVKITEKQDEYGDVYGSKEKIKQQLQAFVQTFLDIVYPIQ